MHVGGIGLIQMDMTVLTLVLKKLLVLQEDSRFCVSRKSRTGVQHPWGVVHMVGARLGCNRGMAGTRWGNSRPFTTITMC